MTLTITSPSGDPIQYVLNGETRSAFECDNTSYVYEKIMEVAELSVHFTLNTYVDIPRGSTTIYKNKEYILLSDATYTMNHEHSYEYNCLFVEHAGISKQVLFKELVTTNGVTGGNGGAKFSLCATANEFLKMFVDNLNVIEKSNGSSDYKWVVGTCSTSDIEQTIDFDYVYCFDALRTIADTFGTEFGIEYKLKRTRTQQHTADGRIRVVYKYVHTYVVSLQRIEKNITEPLFVAYGKGEGCKTIKSEPPEEHRIDRLFVKGSDRNLSATYKNALHNAPTDDIYARVNSPTLHFPQVKGRQLKGKPANYYPAYLGFDGVHFEGEVGYDETKATTYQVGDDYTSIYNKDVVQPSAPYEMTLDLSESIYPHRIGVVTAVVTSTAKTDDGKDTTLYDICDAKNNIDWDAYVLEGETMTIMFQSGELSGKEFNVKYIHEVKDDKQARRFEIVQKDYDGVLMPEPTCFFPKVGDAYIVFHTDVPKDYINSGSNGQGAEWDLLRAAIRYLYANEHKSNKYTLTIDGVWLNSQFSDSNNKKMVCGGILSFKPSDRSDSVLARVESVKRYLSEENLPTIEVSGYERTPNDVTAKIQLAQEIKDVQKEYRDGGFIP